ncbi:MAG TPA: beta-mannosidase [Mycobacteriales bacterium]|nr:beta-mannosidase [Mycobacteriales bacterium]
MNRSRKRLAAVVVALAAAAVVIPVATESRAGATPDRAAGAPFGRFAETSDLTSGWSIQSSATAGTSGAAISRPGYAAAGWLPLSKPETLMAGLVENGRYPNVFYSDNLSKVPTKQFDVNWWYRERLNVNPRPGQHTFLVMNGVSGKADLWLNGVRIADSSQLQGSYSKLEYDITRYVHPGANAIALDVSRNDSDITKFDTPMRYLTQNQVDWNPMSPDQNTGLQFAPQLAQDGPVSVRNAHVVQQDAADLSTADLTVKADLRNNTDSPQRTHLTGAVSHGRTYVPCTATVTVPAHATKTVAITPANCPGLRLVHPAVWWPYQMGSQPLYHLAVKATVDGQRSDATDEDFGIRTVTSHLTKVIPGKTIGKDGYRQYVVNGKPLVIRGGGWSPDLFLRYSSGNVAKQISYIKNMGLNAVRFEGNLPPADMFNQLDRAGVLSLPGWQCCALWEKDSKTWSADLKTNAANQAGNVAAQLRDHPGVMAFFQGSDAAPDAAKEAIYLKAFKAADWKLPQISSANYESSPQLGPSGDKEGGYNYAPPDYYWANGPETVNTKDPTLQMNGSAWGFNTESSAGSTIPTQDSLNRFLTPADQKKIWDPVTTAGQTAGEDMFHTFFYADYTRLSRMGVYNTPLAKRYGPWTDQAAYNRTVQLGEYEIARAQFEAYIGNSKDKANPSTGLIYWMMNKAWPSLQWSLYGDDFDQPGVYFGAKKANESLHIMQSYSDGSVKVANLTGARQSGLRATADLIDLDGTVRSRSSVPVSQLSSQDVRTVLRPKAPAGISPTYFEKLTLTRGSKVVSRNVYWLSTKADKVDWDKTHEPGLYTPANGFATFTSEGYADLAGLQKLSKAKLSVHADTRRQGGDLVTTVQIRNVGTDRTPAVASRADIFGGAKEVLPIQWSDNDVTLWPGETQTITARYSAGDLHGAPTVRISGYNVANQQYDAG